MEKTEIFIPTKAAEIRWSDAAALGPIPQHRDPSLAQVLAVAPDLTAFHANRYFNEPIRKSNIVLLEPDYIAAYLEIIGYSQEFVEDCLRAEQSEDRYMELVYATLTRKNILDPVKALYHEVKHIKPSEGRDWIYARKVLQPISVNPQLVFNQLYQSSLPKVRQPKTSMGTGITGSYSRTHVGRGYLR